MGRRTPLHKALPLAGLFSPVRRHRYKQYGDFPPHSLARIPCIGAVLATAWQPVGACECVAPVGTFKEWWCHIASSAVYSCQLDPTAALARRSLHCDSAPSPCPSLFLSIGEVLLRRPLKTLIKHAVTLPGLAQSSREQLQLLSVLHV